MNLQQPNANESTGTRNRSRDVVPQSGICTRCIDGCRGNCDVFQASMRGRELLYPGPFGSMTAGAEKDYPVDYSHLNIMGYAMGARGLPEGAEAGPNTTLFPDVDTETEYGADNDKVRLQAPVFTGALGSTEVAAKNWDHFAVGAAISGITLVCGENVCGVDPQLERDENGKLVESPEMRHRVEIYRKFHNGYGDLIVQMNVEDTRLGVAEYAIQELGVETIELKWGQGAKCIGGEIQIDNLDRALQLQDRGYLVTPDPSSPSHQKAYKEGEIKHFERHSRLGFVDEEGFHAEVERLRNLGAKRVTLKTGAYPMRELAMALKWASDAKLDLVTIDGAPGGTGMSPWRMMNEWGIPTIYLQSMACELARELDNQGAYVPDLAMAGGLSTEDHIFKALALGAPYFKSVCMGRAIMIPGMVGKNLENWLENGEKLPKTIRQHGERPEQIFLDYEDLCDEFGEDTVKQMPLGAIAMYTFVDKLKVGLQQLMAGSRNFNIEAISRKDLAALTNEAAEITGLP
ncbi:MAG: FMN-binding glutamate synthase family protein, partial [Planctomycetes bacterium]|nr:FMN-binding glutamate synthase family protein [Planctomycetota bacterium]